MAREWYKAARIDGEIYYQKSICCGAPAIARIGVGFGPGIEFNNPICRCCGEIVQDSDDLADFAIFEELNQEEGYQRKYPRLF